MSSDEKQKRQKGQKTHSCGGCAPHSESENKDKQWIKYQIRNCSDCNRKHSNYRISLGIDERIHPDCDH